MDISRLNPVTLISGAATGLGAAAAHDLARHSSGGLVLAGGDEAALEAIADAFAQPPERVSILAFDPLDPDRWMQAGAFVQSQYGRLDWAVINATPPAATDLVEWRRGDNGPDDVALALRTALPLMRANTLGGAAVVTADKAQASRGLFAQAQTAARQGAPDSIRVNTVAYGGADTPSWASLPIFKDLVREHGGERAALDAIGGLPTPVARYGAADDVPLLIRLLLSDTTSVNGAALMVDAGYAI